MYLYECCKTSEGKEGGRLNPLGEVGWRRKSGKKRLQFEVLVGGNLNFSISPRNYLLSNLNSENKLNLCQSQ